MNTNRVILYFVGVGLVVLAMWMFFTQAGLNRWIPVGIAVAAIILIVGLAIMSLGEQGGGEDDIRIEERHVDVGGHGHHHD